MKLNLGSGHSKRDGYVNIDFRSVGQREKPQDVRDLDYPLESVDEVYASNILEHLPSSDFLEMLCKIHLWLKPDGVFKMAIPNMDTILKKLFEGKNDHDLRMWVYGSNDIRGMNHEWCCSENLIRALLEFVGFEIVGYFEGGEDDSGFEYEGTPLSLNLECKRGT